MNTALRLCRAASWMADSTISATAATGSASEFENNSSNAYSRYMGYYDTEWGNDEKSNLFSVRCVQD